MELLGALVLLGLLAVAIVVLQRPLLPGARHARLERTELLRADLEAARDAKYREIRDAELDHRTGKLAREDWAAIDRRLRSEAVDILHRLDELDPAPDPAPPQRRRVP